MMKQKVMLILSDGLRPDALAWCGNPYGSRLLALCPGALLPKVNICDIAPAIAALEGVAASKDWEGTSLL